MSSRSSSLSLSSSIVQVGLAATVVAAPLLHLLLTKAPASRGDVLSEEVEATASTSRSTQSPLRSCLYLGRVWHRRFVPAVHSFWYSIFFTYLDLQEVQEQQVLDRMWPLAASGGRTALMSFDEDDHLKGYLQGQGLTLLERVKRLVEEKTGSRPKGPICLLTHLRVLGYCFNPISFYYCFDETGTTLETVVGEVSNTPWGEMHPYVLDPRNKDQGIEATVRQQHGDAEGGEKKKVIKYRFPKSFHVSPFMDMDHLYDWDLIEPHERVWVSTTMIKDGTTRYFHARFDLQREELNPMTISWCLLRYPAITWAVQFFIHVQAFHLWLKQVPFYPHPEGTETWASRAVGYVMAPLWKLQELAGGGGSTGGDGKSEVVPEMTPEKAAMTEAAAVANNSTMTSTQGKTSSSSVASTGGLPQ